MSAPQTARLRTVADIDAEMLDEVQRGLRDHPKRLPSKYFYDARGSQLFEDICAQPEYYLTRVELAILREHLDDIVAALGRDVLLLEYGSGSGIKTELLLDRLQRPAAYAPIDVSSAALSTSVAKLTAKFPTIEMLPLCADFTQGLQRPRPRRPPARTIVYFPGSTLGNFATHDALILLQRMRRQVGTDGGVLIGIDLKKDSKVIEAAYNDAAGVTSAFTLNVLTRLNRELGADFDLSAFRHRAMYNALAGRIETDLVSLRAQHVRIAAETFAFGIGEAMRVEISCKYSLDDFAQLAARANLRVAQSWVDAQRQFALVYLLPD